MQSISLTIEYKYDIKFNMNIKIAYSNLEHFRYILYCIIVNGYIFLGIQTDFSINMNYIDIALEIVCCKYET